MILAPTKHYISQIWLLCTIVILLPNLATSAHDQEIISGIYGTESCSGPEIRIDDLDGNSHWKWDTTTGLHNVPDQIKKCIQKGKSATEVKRAANGDKVVAIIGYSALMINHTPHNNATDKLVTFGVCLDDDLPQAHTVEMLPGNLFAIATTSDDEHAGFWVYDSSDMSHQTPKQKITGVKDIHGLLWDDKEKVLWAAGNTAHGSGAVPSYASIVGYKYDEANNKLIMKAHYNYTMSCATKLSSEWGGEDTFFRYWDRPHDLVPIPNTRSLLFPMDRDIHTVNILNGEFNNYGEEIQKQYLNGFEELGNRTGDNGEYLPRSDIKSISLNPGNSTLYTQAKWRDGNAIPHQVNLLSPTGKYSSLYKGCNIYRSRWFADITGWPTAP
ncbi:hypothetical protein BDV24DRAFT_155483 [Aspergillus arachidicola]|uniref:Secreted protein n=1 Tax=Aspergillus arachidicola TaxID=656916 RepID=A0A5N6XSQ7_9EURO|nr:hypothetical protein BDV24DRAFT_155483 [Aspergillus arachidicola]